MVVSWLYFLGNDREPTRFFLYGLSLFTKFNQSINLKPQKIGRIQNDIQGFPCVYLLKSVNDFDLSNVIDGFNIKLPTINSKLESDLEFEYSTKSIRNPKNSNFDVPESPISATIEVSSYYVSHINQWIGKESERNAILQILKILEKDTHLKFSRGYARMFGCYEIALDLPEWAEVETPFNLGMEGDVLTFKRINADFAIFVHVIVYKNNETILDEIFLLEKGEYTHSFQGFDLDDFQYWAFAYDGKLLHHEHLVLIKSVVGTIHSLGPTVSIRHKSQCISVTPTTPSVISVEAPRSNNDIMRCHREQVMHSIVNQDFDPKIRQKFFADSSGSLEQVVRYINSFIGNDPSTIYYIDPFISKASLSPICGVDKTSVEIIIISAWKNNDPDIGDSKNIETESIINETRDAIGMIANAGLPASKLKWFNLKDESFHDRFVYLKSSKNYNILSISNSLNNLLGKYNFSIFEFGSHEKIAVQKYLEGIISKASTETLVYPTK